MISEKLEWIWKSPLGSFIAGAAIGGFTVDYLYQIQISTLEIQIEALQRADDKATSERKDERATMEIHLNDRIAKLTSSYEAQLKATQKENQSLENRYRSLYDQYNALSIAYKNASSALDKESSQSYLLVDLQKQEKSLINVITNRRQHIAALSDDYGEAKQKCEDHKNGINSYTVSASDCQRFESLSIQIKTLNDQVTFDEKALLTVQSRIARLIQNKG